MSNGHFWLKDGHRSVGGSGPLGWAAFGLAIVILYLAFPPFTQLVNDIIAFVKMLVVIAVIGAIVVAVAWAASWRR